MPWGGKRAGAGRKALPRLTPEEFDLMVKEQGGMCALCSEPGSAGGLVIDRDELKRIRGLLQQDLSCPGSRQPSSIQNGHYLFGTKPGFVKLKHPGRAARHTTGCF